MAAFRARYIEGKNLVEMLSATSTPIPLAVFRACAAIPDPVIGFLFSRTEQQAAEVGRTRSPRLLKRRSLAVIGAWHCRRTDEGREAG
jgi:hypothetical protein